MDRREALQPSMASLSGTPNTLEIDLKTLARIEET
jgi:hypothetical protein